MIRYKSECNTQCSQPDGKFIANLSTRRTEITIARTLYRKGVSGISRGGERRPVPRADNITTFMCRLSRNSGSLNLLGPYRPGLASNEVASETYSIAQTLTLSCSLTANCKYK